MARNYYNWKGKLGGKMKKLAIVLCLFLAGCAVPQDQYVTGKITKIVPKTWGRCTMAVIEVDGHKMGYNIPYHMERIFSIYEVGDIITLKPTDYSSEYYEPVLPKVVKTKPLEVEKN